MTTVLPAERRSALAAPRRRGDVLRAILPLPAETVPSTPGAAVRPRVRSWALPAVASLDVLVCLVAAVLVRPLASPTEPRIAHVLIAGGWTVLLAHAGRADHSPRAGALDEVRSVARTASLLCLVVVAVATAFARDLDAGRLLLFLAAVSVGSLATRRVQAYVVPAVGRGRSGAGTRAGARDTGAHRVSRRSRPTPHRRLSRVVKHTWERTFAGLALLVFAPLLLGLGAVVRLSSPGPALYRQRRIGHDGVPFTMLKLRTMTTDADLRRVELLSSDEASGPLFKIRDDPRVTPVGRVLRRYSLDELPQLVNVLRGDMALVGPRPPLPSETEQYDAVARRRLAVRPGLTGLWQVSGRSDLSWEESIRLDLRYVEAWSLGLDLRILLRTVPAVLGHRGAY